MTPRAAYEELVQRHRSIAALSSAKGLLEWDQETMMPPGGELHRSQQIALLAGRVHQEVTDARMAELLAAAAEGEWKNDARATETVNVRRWARAHRRETRLDRALVEETAAAVSLAHGAWASARRADDFAAFRPHLERVLDLKKRAASALADGGDPWDAMLEDFEPGMTGARLDALFAPLEKGLRVLLDRILGAPRRPRAEILARRIDIERQRRFVRSVTERLGFDFARGRLDESAHPFSAQLGPGDVRITTRYYEHDLTEGLFGVLHETGHALYDQGLPTEHYGTPRGEAASFGVHESQSRLWENFVGRSPGFWKALYPELRAAWPGVLDDVDEEEFVFAINTVEPGVNRVRADEVTYNLHIFVRFQLERALFAGDLRVADLPGAWRESYAKTVGITPADDADGCLQDGHWGGGLFGYFPTYTLGNVMAAELYRAASRKLGDLDAAFARGNWTELLGWLRENVHAKGQMLEGDALVREVTGTPLSSEALLDALSTKFQRLYRF